MDTTAEGVETHDDLKLIRGLGCSQVQGYIFGEPMEAEEAPRCSARPRPSWPTASKIRATSLQPPSRGGTAMERHDVPGARPKYLHRRRTTETARPRPREQVQLDLPACGNLGAHVRWTKDDRLGIQFDQPYNLRLLGPAQSEKRPSAQPNYLKIDGPVAEAPWASPKEPLRPEDFKRAKRG